MSHPSFATSLVACLSVELPGGAGLPDWVRLVPAGAFVTIDGRGFRADVALLASSVRLPITVDFDHATERGPTTGQPGAAAGWVEQLEARADGLHGRVAWTGLGRTALADRQYRYLSPVLGHEPDGTVTGLRSVALTNNPALPALALLSRLTHEETMNDSQCAALREALGLPADAGIDAIMAAAGAGRTAQATLSAIGHKLGASGSDQTALLARLDTQLNGGVAELTVLRSQVQTLSGQLSALTGAANARRVDELVAAGKVPAGAREHWLALLSTDRSSRLAQTYA